MSPAKKGRSEPDRPGVTGTLRTLLKMLSYEVPEQTATTKVQRGDPSLDAWFWRYLRRASNAICRILGLSDCPRHYRSGSNAPYAGHEVLKQSTLSKNVLPFKG